MRAAFLLSLLLWSWLGAALQAPSAPGPGNDRVETAGGHDCIPFVDRVRPGDVASALDARRPQPLPWLALHASQWPPVPGLDVERRSGPALREPADRAYLLAVSAGPHEPRAPPPARG